AAAAHAHAAGPAVGQAAVHAVLDVVQGVQDDPVLAVGDLVGLERRLGLLLRPVPEDLPRDRPLRDRLLRHHHPPYTRSAGGQRGITTFTESNPGGPPV